MPMSSPVAERLTCFLILRLFQKQSASNALARRTSCSVHTSTPARRQASCPDPTPCATRHPHWWESRICRLVQHPLCVRCQLSILCLQPLLGCGNGDELFPSVP